MTQIPHSPSRSLEKAIDRPSGDQAGWKVSASISTQVPQWHLADTGETIDVDAPDSVAFTGTLGGGSTGTTQGTSGPEGTRARHW